MYQIELHRRKNETKRKLSFWYRDQGRKREKNPSKRNQCMNFYWYSLTWIKWKKEKISTNSYTQTTFNKCFWQKSDLHWTKLREKNKKPVTIVIEKKTVERKFSFGKKKNSNDEKFSAIYDKRKEFNIKEILPHTINKI